MEITPKKKKQKYVSIGLIPNPSSSNSESSTVVPLPQDLITEIILRLPVKSLVKFKCVSKPWLYLISSPQFIKSHFSISSREGQHFNYQLFLQSLASNSCMKHFSLSSALQNPTSTHVSHIEFPSPDPKMLCKIVDIVNGLVCLSIGVKNLYVWNPILNQSKRLPASRSGLSVERFVVHGFGYDKSNDDYKVVKGSRVDSVHGGVVYETKVYSLRTDSWRRIEGFKMSGLHFGNGTYANGKIFWTSDRTFVSGEKWKIVSLDMVSLKYEELQGPDFEVESDDYFLSGSFRGCLSMVCDYSKTKADLWLMDNDGVEESWSKVLSIPYDDVHPIMSIRQVLCILGNGDIVLEDEFG